MAYHSIEFACFSFFIRIGSIFSNFNVLNALMLYSWGPKYTLPKTICIVSNHLTMNGKPRLVFMFYNVILKSDRIT